MTFRVHTFRLSILLGCLSVAWVPGALSQQPPSAPPQPALDGAPLFSENCAACHGTDGRGGERAPNIATTHDVVALADSQLHDIVSKGRLSAGMPGFAALGEDKVTALVAYIRKLQGIDNSGIQNLPGDPLRGETVFFSPGACSGCHTMNGRGGYMGDDLTDFARGRSIESVRKAILHPDTSAGKLVTIETVGGKTIKGLLRSQDNFTIVLQSEDGAFHSLARDNVRSTVSTVAFVPQDYAARFDKQKLDDLISYLLKSAATAKSTPKKADDDD